ncbi:MAG: hypothetical protein VW546_06765 [Gammaproteobacteria bacterium]
MSRLVLTFCAMLVAHGIAAAELVVGERPPEVTLQGDAGGRLDDSLWSSAALVEQWGLTDNTYHVLAFGRDGQLLFSHGGALSDEQVDQLLQRVDTEIAR